MANKPIIMIKVKQIMRYYAQGKSKSEISKLVRSSRNTVKRYIRIFHSEHLSVEQIEGMSDYQLSILFCMDEKKSPSPQVQQLFELMPWIEKELKRKGNTLTRIWKEYLQKYPNGLRYTQFCCYANRYLMRSQPSMHIEHKAGDKMFIDFAGVKLKIIDQESGEIKEVEVFAAILGGSQLTYVEAVASQTKEELIKCCEHALHYFGGVPAAIVPDNLKSAVTKSSKYEPTLNETFAHFAEHYGTAVLPARSYRPRDKALVEGIVKIIYQRIYTALHPQIFFTLEELNAAIRVELENHNNTRFAHRNYSRREQFEEVEKTALQPLPVYRYEFKKQLIVTVMKNNHVCLSADKHYYSVPFHYIGKKVKLLYNSTKVEIYCHLECIAVHLRHMRPHRYTTTGEHLASSHRYVTDWTPQYFIEQGEKINAVVAEYLAKVIETKQHPEQAYKSCAGILHYARKVGSERIINACKRGLEYGAYGYNHIVQILDKGLDQIKDEQDPSLSMPEHHNIRGNEYYQ